MIDVLSDLFILRGVPGHVRSDNGPEFVAKAVQTWITAVGAKTAYIAPGSPWENGYIESFNSKLMDELLNGEIFYTLKEARIIIESWRKHYNTVRPHSSLGYAPPAPEVVLWAAAQPRPASPHTQPSRSYELIEVAAACLQSTANAGLLARRKPMSWRLSPEPVARSAAISPITLQNL